jgi:hypothetical protein
MVTAVTGSTVEEEVEFEEEMPDIQSTDIAAAGMQTETEGAHTEEAETEAESAEAEAAFTL